MISQKYFCEASNGHFAKGLKWTQNWTLEKQNDYVVIRSFLWGLKCTLSGVDPKWFSFLTTFSDKRHFHIYLTKWTIVSIIDFSLWRGYRTLNSCNLQQRMFKDTLYKNVQNCTFDIFTSTPSYLFSATFELDPGIWKVHLVLIAT